MPELLPGLDLGSFIAAPGSLSGREFVRRLRDACRDPGFCYITGHGVPQELDRAMMRVAQRFFALPIAEKRALDIAASPHFRGFTALGGERTKGARDWREQLDAGGEEGAEDVRRDDHYPSQSDGSAADEGVGMHHDSGLRSFVLQDEVGGLNVQHREGLIHATPLASATTI